MNRDYLWYTELESLLKTVENPLDRELTIQEIYNLTHEEIEHIKEYFNSTFPIQLSENNYSCLETARHVIDDIVSHLNAGDVVLSPGDSPYALVKIIQNLDVTFILFPISGLDYRSQQLDQYLDSILLTYEGDIKILDYSYTGRSFKVLNESLSRYYSNIEPRSECEKWFMDLITSSEITMSRCTPKRAYVSDVAWNKVNPGRCAIVITIITLYLLGKL